MQFSKISALASLLAFASAGLHTEEIAVVCTDADPVTITQTVTVTAPCSISPSGPFTTSSSPPAPIVTTVVDKSGSKTFVWVYSTKTDPLNWTPVASTTSSAVSTSTRAIHTVTVGINGTLAYGANQINASIGDIIRFDFNSTNHTVTQSDFLTPCSPKAGGFNTGFNQFNPTNHTGVIFKDFVVNVSTPLWFYCAQTVKVSHCHKGMVLGVNPAGKFPAFLSMVTANSSSRVALSTGNSKPFSTGSVAIPLSTGAPTKGPGPVVPPKPTGTGAYYPKERRAGGKQWFA